MSLNIDQIAEAFCRYKFVVTYPYMADKIKWTIVGREELMGRAAVIDRCTDAAKLLETVSATLTKLKNEPRGDFCSCGRRCTISRSGKSNLKRGQL